MLVKSTCNKLSGKYKIYEKNKIKFEDISGTMMYCSEWKNKQEERIISSLNQSSMFTNKSDTLIILYDNDKKAMKFLKIKNVK
jgi:heat shock protein HslJ